LRPTSLAAIWGTTPAPRSPSAYTAPGAEPRITPRRRTTDRGRTVRVLHIRPALRDRAPSVRGIRHVLSQRASDALAPRTPSADDRAVHGTAGLRVAAGVIPSNSGPCMRRVRKSVSHRRSVRSDAIRCGYRDEPPADWGCSFSPFHAGGEQEPAAGESVRRMLSGAFTVGRFLCRIIGAVRTVDVAGPEDRHSNYH